MNPSSSAAGGSGGAAPVDGSQVPMGYMHGPYGVPMNAPLPPHIIGHPPQPFAPPFASHHAFPPPPSIRPLPQQDRPSTNANQVLMGLVRSSGNPQDSLSKVDLGKRPGPLEILMQEAQMAQIAEKQNARGFRIPKSNTVHTFHLPTSDEEVKRLGNLTLSEVARYPRADPGVDEAKVSQIIACDGKYLLYSIEGGSIRVIRLTGNARVLLTGHENSITHLAQSPIDGRFVSSVDEDGAVRVWKIIEKPSDAGRKSNLSFQVLWSKDSCDMKQNCNYLFSAWSETVLGRFFLVSDAGIEVYDFKNEDTSCDMNLYCTVAHSSKVNCLSASSDGTKLATGCNDGFLRLWDLRNIENGESKALHEFLVDVDQVSSVKSLVWLNSNFLAVSYANNAIVSIVNSLSGTVSSMVKLILPYEKSFLRNYVLISGSYLVTSFGDLNASNDIKDNGLIILRLSDTDSTPRFDLIAPFFIGNRVLGFDVNLKEDVLELFCVQTHAVQRVEVNQQMLNSADSETSMSDFNYSVPMSEHLNTGALKSNNSVLTPPQILTQAAPKQENDATKKISSSSSALDIAKILSRPAIAPSSSSASKKTSSPKIDKPESLQIVPQATSSLISTKNTPLLTEESKDDASLDKTSKSKADNLVAKLDKLFERHHVKMLKIMEKEQKDRQTAEKERFERLLTAVSHTVNTVVPGKIDMIIRDHFSSAIVPYIRQELHQALNGLMSNIGPLVESSIQSATNSVLQSTFSPENLQSSIKEPIVGAFASSFQQILLPAFQASFKEMFSQIDAHLLKSMRERDSKLSEQLSSQTAALENLEPSVAKLSLLVSELSVKTSQFTKVDVGSMTKEQVISFAEDLLKNKQYNDAFTEVLNYGNLDVVIWLCSSLNEILYDVQPVLSGPVTLSLLQQLSHSLENDTGIKLTWISGIFLGLKSTDEHISDHIPAVLETVFNNIESQKKLLDPILANQANMIQFMIRKFLNR